MHALMEVTLTDGWNGICGINGTCGITGVDTIEKWDEVEISGNVDEAVVLYLEEEEKSNNLEEVTLISEVLLVESSPE